MYICVYVYIYIYNVGITIINYPPVGMFIIPSHGWLMALLTHIPSVDIPLVSIEYIYIYIYIYKYIYNIYIIYIYIYMYII